MNRIVCLAIVSMVSLGSLMSQAQQPIEPSGNALANHLQGPFVEQSDTTYFVVVDVMPEPVGGVKAIQEHVKYPESAKKDGVEGTVYIEAFIDKKGNVVKAEIVKGVRNDLDRAAIASVTLVKFIPGKHQGKSVPVQISIPIRFRLSKSETAATESLRASVTKPTVVAGGPYSKLAETITYPAIAVRAGVQGEVRVRVFFQNQSIRQMIIERGLGAGCDEEVMRAVLAYNFREDPMFERIGRDGSVLISVQFVLPKR